MTQWNNPTADFLCKALRGQYDESKHPRKPKGAKGGGQFAPKMRGTNFERQSQARALSIAPLGAKNSLQFTDEDGKRGLENIRWFYENIENIQRLQMKAERSAHEDALLGNLILDAETKMGETVPQMRYTLDQMQGELPYRMDRADSPSHFAKLQQLDVSTRKRIQELDGWKNLDFSKRVIAFDSAVSQMHEDYDFLFHFVRENIQAMDENEESEAWVENMEDGIYKLRGRNARVMAEFAEKSAVAWDDPTFGVLRKFAPAGNVNAGPQSGVGQSWNAQAHPRQSAGSDRGGEFASKPGGGRAGGGGFAQGQGGGMMQAQAPTLPNVFRMYADESGTAANHETWVGAGAEHGFDETNARILARPLSTLHVAPHTQKLIMQRAKEIHDALTESGKTPRTAFDTWRYLKAELPFILNVNLPTPQKGKAESDAAPGKGESALRVGGRQSRLPVNDGLNNALAQRDNEKTSAPKSKGGAGESKNASAPSKKDAPRRFGAPVPHSPNRRLSAGKG